MPDVTGWHRLTRGVVRRHAVLVWRWDSPTFLQKVVEPCRDTVRVGSNPECKEFTKLSEVSCESGLFGETCKFKVELLVLRNTP